MTSEGGGSRRFLKAAEGQMKVYGKVGGGVDQRVREDDLVQQPAWRRAGRVAGELWKERGSVLDSRASATTK